MLNRARDIAQMMGYDSIDATLEAIGRGDLILLKLPEGLQLRMAEWIRSQAADVEEEDAELAEALEDLADGVEFALELDRYPSTADICEMDLPHGWPSYCDKRRLQGE
jgi:hypothetical protein